MRVAVDVLACSVSYFSFLSFPFLSFRMINPSCSLSSAAKAGCCYMQDARKKYKSRAKGLIDHMGNLPMLADVKGYSDGYGARKRRIVCYAEYCPACQTYWHERLRGPVLHLLYWVEDGTSWNAVGKAESIAAGETRGDAMDRVLRRAAELGHKITFAHEGASAEKNWAFQYT
jgi:hypothetical protein